MNLHLKLARAAAVLLLLLAALPCTAPFAVCDIAEGSHPGHSATRHVTHAGAVVRPVARLQRSPVILTDGPLDLVALPPDAHASTTPVRWRPPSGNRQLVLRL